MNLENTILKRLREKAQNSNQVGNFPKSFNEYSKNIIEKNKDAINLLLVQNGIMNISLKTKTEKCLKQSPQTCIEKPLNQPPKLWTDKATIDIIGLYNKKRVRRATRKITQNKIKPFDFSTKSPDDKNKR